jgi:hypothetical protein
MGRPKQLVSRPVAVTSDGGGVAAPSGEPTSRRTNTADQLAFWAPTERGSCETIAC